MTRSPTLTAMLILLLAGLLVGFGLEVAVGDFWRSVDFLFVFGCLWTVRDDLTRSETL